MIRISISIIFIFISFSYVGAKESDKRQLPVFECNVESSIGNFNSFLVPIEGDKLYLDINDIEASLEAGRFLKFNDRGIHDNYISIPSPLVLTVLDNPSNNRFALRLKAEDEFSKITIDISPFRLDEMLHQMLIVEESDLIRSVAILLCTQFKN